MFKELKETLKEIINRGEDLLEIYSGGRSALKSRSIYELSHFIIESKRILEFLNIRGSVGKIDYQTLIENQIWPTIVQNKMVKFLNFEIDIEDLFEGYPSTEEMGEESRRQNIEEQHARKEEVKC